MFTPSDTTDPFWPRWWPERLDAPKRRRTPSGIFVCNMGDLFGPWVPDWMIEDVLEVVRACRRHRFYFLTKYPLRLPQFNPWPRNAWVGVTATDFDSLITATLAMQNVEATVKYVSLEPLLSWETRPFPLRHDLGPKGILEDALGLLSWLITGPLNGKLAKRYPCAPRWLDEIAAAGHASGVAVYEKPECGRILERELWKEWPDE